MKFRLCLLLNGLFFSVVDASSARWKHAVVKRGFQDLEREYDYIIVGAGTAGTTVADRLSEGGTKTVLLVEYGPLELDDSFMPPRNSPAPQFLYNLTSVPQPHANNRTFPAANGCVVGGGSTVNGQIFDRGSKSDYDAWASFPGNEGWKWDELLPYFRKSVTFTPPSKEMQDFGMTFDIDAAWGGDTPIYASYPPYQYPGQKIQWDAWAEKDGVEVQREHAGGKAYGLFWLPTSMDPRSYNRSFSGMGHWIVVPPRENYHILPDHKVVRINFANDVTADLPRAVGVNITPRYGNITTFTIKARQEVVVSAAAVRTPHLLQNSGIGPRGLLEEAGIETIVDLPGVGANLQDHAFTSAIFNFTTDVFPNPTTMSTNETFREEAMELWEKNKTGPYAFWVPSSGIFLPAPVFLREFTNKFVEEITAQSPETHLPEGFPQELIDGYKAQKEILAELLQSKTSAVLESLFYGATRATIIYLKPFSRGTVKINPEDPSAEPIFDDRLFSNPVDLKIIVQMVQYVRAHFRESSILKRLGPVEVAPGPEVKTDEDVAEWLVKGHGIQTSNGHSCCTAAMMPRDLGGVVDGALKVYGTEGLSVADLSIVPLIPGTHTQSTAYAIGEKAADLIKARSTH